MLVVTKKSTLYAVEVLQQYMRFHGQAMQLRIRFNCELIAP